MRDIVVRRAGDGDDFQKIASCIYLTDPFIYPAAFGEDIQNAAYAISKLMSIKEGLFHPDNILLALCDEEICGILLFNKDGAIWDCEQCAKWVQGIVPSIDNFNYVSDVYFVTESVVPPEKHIEVIACCVLPEFRNIGVGKRMLEWLIQEYPNYTMTLDVLASNSSAIHLYQKCGFEIVGEQKGFCLNEESRPDCYKMVKYWRLLETCLENQ